MELYGSSPLSRPRVKDKDLTKLLSPAGTIKEIGSAPVMSPITLPINRDEERDIGNPRCIVMSRDSESTLPSETSSYNLNASHNLSLNASYGFNQSLNTSCAQNSSLNSSLFIYDTPEIVKYPKYPRVDLPKLRLPPSIFLGGVDDSNEDESETEFYGIEDNKAVDIVIKDSKDEKCKNDDNKSKNEMFCQSNVEEELVRYELKCMEDAERRVEERKVKWEALSLKREREARES